MFDKIITRLNMKLKQIYLYFVINLHFSVTLGNNIISADKASIPVISNKNKILLV